MARTGWLISFLLLGVLIFHPGIAAAQSKNCTDETAQCSVAEAEAQCQAFQPSPAPPLVLTRKECRREGSGNSGYFFMFYWGKYPGNEGEQGAFNAGRYWWWRNKCGQEAPYTGSGPWSSEGSAKNGSIGCRNGCDGAWFSNSDSTKTWNATGAICPEDEKKNCEAMGAGYYWNGLLRVCEPREGKCPDGGKPNSLGQCAPEPCPEGMTQQPDGTCKNKENECPAGQVKSPDGKCLPGDGQCAAGEVRGKDGTCKKDRDGDGEPDPGEEGEGPNGETADAFSGGDTCNEPPSCSGSPILCGQARIQWRIDCNTRKNRNIAGGACSAMPICTGEKCDALEYSSLLMQWRTACAVEKALTLGNNGGGNDGAQPDWTKVGSMSQDPGAGSSPSDTNVLTVKKLSVDDLDQSGIGGGGGGCIGFAASGGGGMGAGFAQAMASPPAFFCDYIGVLKAICILGASVVCVVILVSGGKS
jgi:hypothetical protein